MRTNSLGARPFAFAALALAPLACTAAPAASDGATGNASSAESEASACADRFVSARDGSDTLHGGAPNDCTRRHHACATIQHAIDVACAGDRVDVERGRYRENVRVTKSIRLRGDGSRTVIVPAMSAPKPCEDTALCGGAASSVVLVQASHVSIAHLAIDGDDPRTTSGVVVNGADVDARNGVVTDDAAGALDGLVVDDVTVRNVFFRGVQDGAGGSFVMRGSHVENVVGAAASIGIFDYGCTGTIERNTLDTTSAAIVGNHSGGTVFAHNFVTRSASGIHTDNGGDHAGSSPDLVEDNVVVDCTAGGYGAWVFVPNVAATVRRNFVSRCAVGFAAFGGRTTERTTFTDDVVDGHAAPGSIGLQVTTDQLGFGAGDVFVAASSNVLARTGAGLLVVDSGGAHADVTASCDAVVKNGDGVLTSSSGLAIHDSAIVRNDLGVDASLVTGAPVDARANFWGCAAGPGAAGCDKVTAQVDASSPESHPASCVPFHHWLDGDNDVSPSVALRAEAHAAVASPGALVPNPSR